jgi:hypothetical protein
MATSSVAQRQLSDRNSQGTLLGASSTDLIGFYGVTSAVARQGLAGSSFASISQSSGALSSSLAIALHNLGLINCSTVAA